MKLSTLLAAFALSIAPAALASAHDKSPKAEPAASTASAMADGEVRKVDKEAGKITLKHGPIPNLDMPAMSMVFRAKDPAMLDAVKAGDKIHFKADKIQGAYTITEMQHAK